MQLKIVSWNIWVDGIFDEIVEFLDQSKADIIGLQEVKNDDPGRDIIRHLESLGYNYVFAPVKKVFEDKTYNDGPAIFSRYKILASETYVLSDTKSRVAVRADIEADGTVLHVFSTHLVHTHQQPSELQELQADNLIKILPPDHTVVMGDFNATPDSAAIQKISRVLVNTDPQSTPTWSVYPEGCPACNLQGIDICLDYIFTSRDLKANSFQVGSSQGSDHLPISVKIQI